VSQPIDVRFDHLFAPGTDVITIGAIGLPSGRIVACDPYFCADAQPYARSVPPGEYPVQLRRVSSKSWGERIALARVLLQEGGEAERFEPAIRDSDEVGAFFVDAGVASFMDETTRASFARALSSYAVEHPDGNYYLDILQGELKRSATLPDDEYDLGLWAIHRVRGTTQDVAIFASGHGDGWYRSWWGISRHGDVVSLVTDFGLLTSSE
jgi:uncharacterized protein DUF4241